MVGKKAGRGRNMATLTVESVTHALRSVQDPELGKDLVTLGMVSEVRVEGSEVSLTVVLTVAGCPMKAKIKQDVVDAIKALGATSVGVTWGEMTSEQRKALSGRLQAERKQTGADGTTRPPAYWLQEQGVVCLAVVSGKGGVGKSTVASNLSVALARAGCRVGLVDADIYGFSIPEMMGVQRRPVVIDETVVPVEQHGVQVMSMGFFVEDNAPVIWRGPMLGKMLRNFFVDIHWNQVTHFVLDLPPGTGDIALDVHQMIPQCKQILVTTPHPSAAHVAIRAGSMALHKTKHELLGVVENMAWYENRLGEKEQVFGSGGGKKVAETLGVSLLSQIPLVSPGGTSEGVVRDAIYPPEHRLGAMYDQLAAAVLSKINSSSAAR